MTFTTVAVLLVFLLPRRSGQSLGTALGVIRNLGEGQLFSGQLPFVSTWADLRVALLASLVAELDLVFGHLVVALQEFLIADGHGQLALAVERCGNDAPARVIDSEGALGKVFGKGRASESHCETDRGDTLAGSM